jgi:hypothetical protein
MKKNGDRADHPHGEHDSSLAIAGPDATLGGYFLEHGRPPGFDGADGQPYTVGLESEKTPNLAAPFEGYLVFPRWAATGLGVVGHVESPTLVSGKSREEVLERLGELSLRRVKALLDEDIERRDANGEEERSGEDRG